MVKNIYIFLFYFNSKWSVCFLVSLHILWLDTLFYKCRNKFKGKLLYPELFGLWEKEGKCEKNVPLPYFCLFILKENGRKEVYFHYNIKTFTIHFFVKNVKEMKENDNNTIQNFISFPSNTWQKIKWYFFFFSFIFPHHFLLFSHYWKRPELK